LQVAEGLAPQTPLHLVFDIINYRKEAQLATERRQAETLFRMARLFVEGGVYLDAISHLYPESIIKGIKQRQAEIEDEEAQLRRLEQVKAIAKRFT
jgi:hypothetical protein